MTEKEKERVWYELGYIRGMTAGIMMFIALELAFGIVFRSVLK